jgi:hypothetical protein
MPDPHMPDIVTEVLRLENARLLHDNAALVLKIAECNDQRRQFALALAEAVDENRELKRKLSNV